MISGQGESHTAEAGDVASEKKKRKALILILCPLIIIASFFTWSCLRNANTDKENHQKVSDPQSESNTVVPTNGNISNRSFAATDGESIYYSSFDQNGLIEVNNDLSGAVKLTEERASFIYPYVDSVICVIGENSEAQKEKIVRINKDDSGQETLAEPENEIACMYLDGESIFYSLADPGTGLYMCDIASKQVTPLSGENISMINAAKDRIYCKYTDRNTGKASIMSIGKDGQDVRFSLVNDDKEIAAFEVYGEHIYYSDSNADLYRIPLTGGISDLLVSNGAISGFNIAEDRIYLLTVTKSEIEAEAGIGKTVWRESVISCNLDGTGETPIAKDLLPGSPINIIEGKIYGFGSGTDTVADNPSENQQLFRMDVDGKSKETIPAGA